MTVMTNHLYICLHCERSFFRWVAMEHRRYRHFDFSLHR